MIRPLQFAKVMTVINVYWDDFLKSFVAISIDGHAAINDRQSLMGASAPKKDTSKSLVQVYQKTINPGRKERIMGIIKEENIIAWEDGGKIICAGCGDPPEGKPLTKDDFKEGDIVICDDPNCPHPRIQ